VTFLVRPAVPPIPDKLAERIRTAMAGGMSQAPETAV
jgi:hypothetical protein